MYEILIPFICVVASISVAQQVQAANSTNREPRIATVTAANPGEFIDH